MAPIKEKVYKIVGEVAAEKGYSYVFRRNIDANIGESQSSFAYMDDNGLDNLSDAILLKFGVSLPKK